MRISCKNSSPWDKAIVPKHEEADGTGEESISFRAQLRLRSQLRLRRLAHENSRANVVGVPCRHPERKEPRPSKLVRSRLDAARPATLRGAVCRPGTAVTGYAANGYPRFGGGIHKRCSVPTTGRNALLMCKLKSCCRSFDPRQRSTLLDLGVVGAGVSYRTPALLFSNSATATHGLARSRLGRAVTGVALASLASAEHSGGLGASPALMNLSRL
jgi:hypothetical protein